MDDLETISETWNSLVRGSDSMEATAQNLASGKVEPGFHIPGFAKFSVLRPLLTDAVQEARIAAAAHAVLSAHNKVLHMVLESDVLKKRHFSNLFEWTEEVLSLDRPGPIHAVCLRFDGSIVNGKPIFFELNADIPQGIGLGDSFATFLSELPFYQEMGNRYHAKPVLVLEAFLQAMLAEWKGSGGGDNPRTCFLTWRDDPVRQMEAELDSQYFQSRGFEAIAADPSELEYDGSALSARGEPIDLLYRIISTGEVLQRAEELETLIKAEKAGDVLMVNSFRSELMGNKAMFALLHDEGFQDAFSTVEKAAISSFVPWTRVVREGSCTDPSGEQVDMPEWVAGHREDLVLKPAHDFAGHGVTLGSQSKQDEWEAALALALEHDFIVQKRIEMGMGVYPIAEEGMPLRELYEDVDPFMLGNVYSGCLTRLSEDELTNVHLHGALGAVFQLSET